MAEELNQEATQELQEPHGEEQRPEIDWKAEARKWEGRSKENAERLKSIETENAQSKARLDALEKRASKAEQEASDLRKQKEQAEITEAVASKSKLPREVIEMLRGETEDELAEMAEKLRSFFPTAPAIKDSGNPMGHVFKADDKTDFVRNLFTNE